MNNQHRYIKLDEFFSSWDKTYDALNNIDYAMFHLINLLGEDLENDFFKSENVHYEYVLSHEAISDFSFAIVDTLEVFLNNRCVRCPVKCFRNPEDVFKSSDDIPTIVKTVIIDDESKNKEALSIDLLNYVINPMVSKFFKTKETEDKEYSVFLYRLKKFLEQQLVFHLTETFKEYLKEPLSTAGELFDELKHFDRLFDSQFDNIFKSAFENSFDSGITDKDEPWLTKKSEFDDVLDAFIEGIRKSFRSSYILDKHSSCVKALLEFVESQFQETDLKPKHLDEFFYKEFLYKFTMVDENQIKYYFIIFGKFFRWYDDEHGTSLTHHFSTLCKNHKAEIIRCQNFLYHYAQEYNPIDDLLYLTDDDVIVEGMYEIKLISKVGGLMLEHIETKEIHHLVKFQLKYLIYMKEGDIIHVRMNEEDNFLRIRELIRIFPKISKFFMN